jgi:hypothetical protein
MIMARNNATPITFWLSLPLSSLLPWIKVNNKLNKQQK